MKLISKPAILEKEFLRMMNTYDNYYWITAWAGIGSSIFHELNKQEGKIRKLVVGTHFYQTHPDFIETFMGNDNVRFINQPDGTFHPKTYLFYNSDKQWEILIGSANLTQSAFTKNTEVSVLISSLTAGIEVFKDVKQLIDNIWGQAKRIDKEELSRYRVIWNIHRPKLRSLANKYGGKKSSTTPTHETNIMILSWKDFVDKIKKDKNHGLKRRLKVLENAKTLFQSVEHFSELSDNERKYIAGIHNHLDLDPSKDWGFFGSMIGAGIFKNRIGQNDKNISLALDQIPLEGPVSKIQYDKFIKYFSAALPGIYTATSSRLLAMKRPDIFFCLTSANQKRFCQDFGIIRSEIDYEGYWQHIIARIFDSEWWVNSNPLNKTEEKINQAKAAFLDAIYYDG